MIKILPNPSSLATELEHISELKCNRSCVNDESVSSKLGAAIAPFSDETSTSTLKLFT